MAYNIISVISHSAGKRYGEIFIEVAGDGQDGVAVGISADDVPTESTFIGSAGIAYAGNGLITINGADDSGWSTYNAGDVIGVAIDLDTGAVWLRLNGVWLQGDPAIGDSPLSLVLDAGPYYLAASIQSGYTFKGTLQLTPATFSDAAPTGFTAWGTP